MSVYIFLMPILGYYIGITLAMLTEPIIDKRKHKKWYNEYGKYQEEEMRKYRDKMIKQLPEQFIAIHNFRHGG